MASILLGFLSIYVECLIGAIFGLFPSSNLARRTDSGFCDVILLSFNYVLIFLNPSTLEKVIIESVLRSMTLQEFPRLPMTLTLHLRGYIGIALSSDH